MAKEMMIVFVYDTECCQNEDDDPVNAVLYFHPSWVSDTQKVALCGQLMGTANFLRGTFGKPNVIALQNGKFVLKSFGRFILSVGTDRNIAQSLLQHRANLLSSLLRLFHRDIQTLHDQFTASGQYKNISEKLYHIFETFLPILQYNGNIYQNMPISKLPKSANNIFLEAMHTLQSCQQTKDVLGGAILYHNKVIATQLCPSLTKNLVLTDPFRIKTTAESIPVNFHVPVGCQLIVVYIPVSQYEDLRENVRRLEMISATASNEANTGNNGNGAINCTGYPFQFKKKVMKREKSMVFTDIPEECAINSTQNEKKEEQAKPDNGIQSIVPPSSLLIRPNHLPLRFKNVTSRDIPESGFSSSITFDEQDSFPQFIGRTSVCSTPMTENKILQGNIAPICATTPFIPELDDGSPKDKPIDELSEPGLEHRKALSNSSNTHILPTTDISDNVVDKPFIPRQHSFCDLADTLKMFNKIFSLKQKNNYERIMDQSPDEMTDSNSKNNFTESTSSALKYRTLCDPSNPFFLRSGAPISQFLFKKYVKKHHQQTVDFINDAFALDSKSQFQNRQRISEIEAPAEPPPQPNTFETAVKPFESNGESERKCRKALSLPLKSFNSDALKSDSNAINETRDSVACGSIIDTVAQRRKLSGLQLTPLITKLSIVALNDERSSGFSSWDTTPGIELATPLDGLKLFRRPSFAKVKDVDTNDGDSKPQSNNSDEEAMKRVELFICGQNNMTMLLLLEENFQNKKEMVQNMFDLCISKLPRLEANLNQILNINVGADKADGGYSFLNIDSDWDTLDRNGPWSTSDLNFIEHMRHDFEQNDSLYNLILRAEDSVIYGQQCSGSKIFYKQMSQFQNGLPPPADTMGSISKHARRHLERDHSIVLL